MPGVTTPRPLPAWMAGSATDAGAMAGGEVAPGEVLRSEPRLAETVGPASIGSRKGSGHQDNAGAGRSEVAPQGRPLGLG